MLPTQIFADEVSTTVKQQTTEETSSSEKQQSVAETSLASTIKRKRTVFKSFGSLDFAGEFCQIIIESPPPVSMVRS